MLVAFLDENRWTIYLIGDSYTWLHVEIHARGILMEWWLPGIRKSQSCVISFSYEIGGNRTNIKKDIAMCLSWSRILARFQKPEVQHLFPLRFWAFWRKNGGNRTNIKEDIAICLSRSRILARSREISQTWGPTFIPLDILSILAKKRSKSDQY